MVTGIKGCALFLREPESGIFSLYAFYGIGDPTEELRIDEPLHIGNAPLLDQLVEYQNPLYIQDPKMDLNLPESFSAQMEKDTLILLPLIAREQVLGAFMLANEPKAKNQRSYNQGFSDDRLKIIQGIIQQTAIAIENIRLLEAKQEEAYVSTVLLQSAQAVVSSADLQDTLDSIVHIMPILVGIETSIIYVWDPEVETFRITQAATKDKIEENELMGTTYALGDFPILDAVFTNNRPVVYPFIDSVLPAEDWDLIIPDEGQIDPLSIVQSRYPLLMCFPLAMKEEVFGVLIAEDMTFSMSRERRFELINGMAQQASLAIQNDVINRQILERERLDREFQLAREIQQTFLPSTELELKGWEMDVRWETARQVGGDFYDYFMLPDGRLAFIIADVSDKGLAASLYMAVTRTLIRAAAQELQSPAKTLERVNELLLDNSQNGLFVTVFFGILDPEKGHIVYTIAGHNPPMLQHYKSKNVITLDKGGIAIGALPNIHLPQSELILDDGDCLILYTDGVTEAFNENDEMYGSTRLINILKKTFGMNAHTVVKELETDLSIFRGNATLSDDTTILALCKCLSLTNDHRDSRGS
jgi:serine phosphatase RsbU (regulator of sigma subunit)